MSVKNCAYVLAFGLLMSRVKSSYNTQFFQNAKCNYCTVFLNFPVLFFPATFGDLTVIGRRSDPRRFPRMERVWEHLLFLGSNAQSERPMGAEEPGLPAPSHFV